MAKRNVGSQIGNLIPDHQKSGVNPISLLTGGVWHIVEKNSTRATTLLQTSSQVKVCTQSYEAPTSRKSQLWQFWDSHLRVLGQNAIWKWASWRGTKYTIRGKVVVSLKSRPWWILWVRGYSWPVLTPKVFQLCINQLFVWFV